MRPASEVNSALELFQSEIDRGAALNSLHVARDVLAWVMGGRVPDDGPNLWLVAYLLDDPPQLDDTDPRAN